MVTAWRIAETLGGLRVLKRKRFTLIATLAEDVLGSREKATRWLHRPNRALGHATPLHQMDTDLGARQVEDLLLRIAHGVYS